jgi:ComF family protein
MQVVTMINIDRVKRLHKEICNGFTELIFPAEGLCPVCQQEKSNGQRIGKNCLAKIALVVPPVCNRCGRPQRLEGYSENLCKQCRETRYYFSEARAVAVYEGSLREILTELKYRYRPELGEVLGKLLVEWVKLHHNFKDFQLIIPIPINDQKLKQRGYNQAELLAKPLQRYLGIPLTNDIIVREKITESQNALCKNERFRNMQGAFRVVAAGRLSGAKILLVDDILTTGATASEAARVLLRAGASEVKVLTVAVGIIDSQWL